MVLALAVKVENVNVPRQPGYPPFLTQAPEKLPEDVVNDTPSAPCRLYFPQERDFIVWYHTSSSRVLHKGRQRRSGQGGIF